MNPDRLSDSKIITTAGGETTILAEPGRILGFFIITDGTNIGELNVWDGPSASAKKKLRGKCAAASLMSGGILQSPIKVTTSIVATVTGTGAEAVILFSS